MLMSYAFPFITGQSHRMLELEEMTEVIFSSFFQSLYCEEPLLCDAVRYNWVCGGDIFVVTLFNHMISQNFGSHLGWISGWCELREGWVIHFPASFLPWLPQAVCIPLKATTPCQMASSRYLPPQLIVLESGSGNHWLLLPFYV